MHSLSPLLYSETNTDFYHSETPAEETSEPSKTYSVPSSEGTGVYSKPVSPYETTSAPVAEYTGAASRVAHVGAGLVGVAAAAVLLL